MVLLAAVASMALAGCGKVVQPGNEGILIKSYGNGAGVQTQPLNVGWHATGIGERILEYPTITKNYSFARAGDGDSKDVNEEIVFADSSGLPMSADIQVTLAVEPSKVANIYQKYRLDFADLLYGPVRAQVRTSIAAEASQVTSTEMFSAKRAVVINRALADVQAHFKDTGVTVSDIQWLGNIRAPQSVLDAIQLRTKVEQETQIAIANRAKAEAQGAANVATAEANKKVKELESEALNTAGGEKNLRQQWIQKWDGKLPTVITSANSSTLLQIPQ